MMGLEWDLFSMDQDRFNGLMGTFKNPLKDLPVDWVVESAADVERSSHWNIKESSEESSEESK